MNENAGQATEGYDRLGSQTGQNFSTTSRATTNVAENITERQEEVRETSFVGTTLDVEGDGDEASFTDPLAISGDLSAENGTAVADEEIRLRVGNRTYDTTTDGDGAFEIEYRPTQIPSNASDVRIEYLPKRGSPYFNSTDSIPISVEQVEPNVTVQRRPDTASLGTNVTVAGRVSVEDRGVRVPVAIRIGDEVVAQGMPADDGSFATTVRLPADVPAGDQPVVATASRPGRAIAPGNATTTLAVEPTNTSLVINASRVNESAVAVDGRLTSGDGRSVANETVLLGINGTATTEVRTDENGTFSGTVPISESQRDDATLVLGALFDGSGKNLETAEARARIERGTAEDWLADLAPVAAGLIAALGLGAWYAVRRRREESDRERPSVNEAIEERDEEPGEPIGEVEGTDHSLERARELIDRGETNEGVVAAYLAVRERLARRADVDEGRTHWEFYAESADHVSDDEADSLRSLTRAYERAAFAPGRLSTAIAERVLDDAGRFDATNEEPTAD
ncbi:DUF4129 domain-containing protein [Halomarina halobia]|uniref:DUF4129 domain-containing protein n=1 Tax=Halomarina halobia TaxID=3033386 RepID=UPI0023E801FD|nr:DUF4129 domain-containing protein [Halomarina sp. PSR21]